MGRAPCCEKVGLKRGRWTAEEDAILTKYIQANGEGSWRSLPKNAGLLRCGKSCRLRWINYLRFDLKRGNITAEEEDVIIKLHTSWGNRWSLIADHLPGRTDNEIKNYWNTHLSRKIQSFRRPTTTTETLPQSAVDCQLAMKKNNSYNNSSTSCTPNLENEALSGTIQNRDTVSTMLGQPCESKTEEEVTINLIVPNPCQDPCGERENLILDHSVSEERENTNEINVSHCEDQELDDLFDTCQELDGHETLCLGDIFGEGFLDDSDGGAFTVGEEIENNNAVVISEDQKENGGTINPNDNPSSINGESGEWSSSTYSTNACIDLDLDWDWDWDWDVVFQGHDDHDQLWGEEEKMLSWLWESDNVEEDCNQEKRKS